jgi:hypothetical protein
MALHRHQFGEQHSTEAQQKESKESPAAALVADIASFFTARLVVFLVLQ